MAWSNANNTGPYNKTEWRKVRQEALQALDYKCAECLWDQDLELDHIINVKAGGSNTIDNAQFLCKRCHQRKTQAEATVAKNAWKRKPEVPPWETEGTRWAG